MTETGNTTPEASQQESASGWQAKHVYLMATACLILGVSTGYFLRGSQSPAVNAPVAAPIQQQAAQPQPENAPPSLEKMKQMADKAAAPVMEKLQSNPKDFDALNEAGKIYRATHQFQLAADYYQKALAINPKNVAVRTDLASCLYYTGDVDGALAQLDKALSYDPKFFGALLNTGIIKMQAKNDVSGAVASWEKILKTDATPEQKQMVKGLIARATKKNQQPADEASKS